VVQYRRNQVDEARSLCHRSVAVAQRIADWLLVAEALNTLGVLDLQTGRLEDADKTFRDALAQGGVSRELRARAEQNLGILANIRGDLTEAITHYQGSLEAYRACGDEHGCAIAFHNLGMVSADQKLYDDADTYFTESLGVAERTGEVELQGHCLVNHADVHAERQQFEDARRKAEAALVLFDQLGDKGSKSTAYRVIGMVYRDTGKAQLAESRLKSAIELASAVGYVLSEAESTRELAILYQGMGRNQEALTLLNKSHRLFSRLNARVDLVNVGGKVASLEGTYLAVVKDWGQSIESSDTYTYGHCERVASYATAVARAAGLDDIALATIRLGAYLHDLGKVKVPHEVLNKPGKLTDEEFDLVKMHPVWGVEMLASVEFPWDLKPIIRWHHERYDGTGYPDRLKGDEFPVSAQVVGIVDVYDALTTDRPYRPGLTHEAALAEITRCRHWWSPRVFDAFVAALPAIQDASKKKIELTTAA
ncbi:MAG TPA: HD domain-containing phosphohydrolase, partial [Gemmatimonadales bacterium]|nr:HD domain-containing phosphohydrolase [Gemmatimonadales bacterium]